MLKRLQQPVIECSNEFDVLGGLVFASVRASKSPTLCWRFNCYGMHDTPAAVNAKVQYFRDHSDLHLTMVFAPQRLTVPSLVYNADRQRPDRRFDLDFLSMPPSSDLGPEADRPAAASPNNEPRSLRIEDWLTVLVMGFLALITFVNVLVRYFTNSSFAWTEELSVFLMIVLALVGGSAAVARDRHIRIEFFCDSGSAARRRRLAQLGAAMVALLFAVIAVLSVRVVWDDFTYGETSPGIGVPQWWYSIWLPVFSALISSRAVGLLLRRSRQPDVKFLQPLDPDMQTDTRAERKP